MCGGLRIDGSLRFSVSIVDALRMIRRTRRGPLGQIGGEPHGRLRIGLQVVTVGGQFSWVAGKFWPRMAHDLCW